MSEIVFIADPHIANHRAFGGALVAGINRRCRLACNVLHEVAAHLDPAQPLVILGDTFDAPDPIPQVLTEVGDLLHETHAAFLVGNHEMVSSAPGDHALGPLCHRIADRPMVRSTGDVDLILIPFRAGQAVETLPKDIKSALGMYPRTGKAPLLLCMHYGVSVASDPGYMTAAPDAVPLQLVNQLAAEHDIQAVFAGHWHTHQYLQAREEGKPLVVQVGALVPTGWDNPGMNGYGTVVHYDPLTEAMTIEHLPGPRFIKWSWPPGSPNAFPDPPKGGQVFIRVTAPADRLDDARLWIEELRTLGKVEAGEAVPDEAPAKEAARKAAESARSTDTMAEALAAFVAAMPLAEGVDRDEVLGLARKYMSGGA